MIIRLLEIDMKRIFYVCAAALLIAACGQKKTQDYFEIKGKVWDFNGYATLTFSDPVTNEDFADTVDLVDGCYCFKGKVSDPTFGQIIFFPENSPRIRSSIIVENANLTAVEGFGLLVSDGPDVRSLRDITYQGGPNNDFNIAIKKSYDYVDDIEKFKGIRELMRIMSSCGIDDLDKYMATRQQLMDEFGASRIKEYQQEQMAASLKYVASHPDVELAAYYLMQCNAYNRPLDELEKDFSHLSEKVQNCYFASGVRSIIESKKAEAAKEE